MGLLEEWNSGYCLNQDNMTPRALAIARVLPDCLIPRLLSRPVVKKDRQEVASVLRLGFIRLSGSRPVGTLFATGWGASVALLALHHGVRSYRDGAPEGSVSAGCWASWRLGLGIGVCAQDGEAEFLACGYEPRDAG
jgi:hypothetical protein